MRMSTKGRFAVNSMIDLALRESGGPVALASIGARQQISLSYLEQLFSRLRQQGLVESTRGPGGGYTLGRAADQISLAEIVAAVDEDSLAPQGQEARPPAAGAAMTDELWTRLQEVMVRHMSTITLKSLVDEQIARGVEVDVKPARRQAISSQPVVKPVRTTAPNSVFAFGRSFAR